MLLRHIISKLIEWLVLEDDIFSDPTYDELLEEDKNINRRASADNQPMCVSKISSGDGGDNKVGILKMICVVCEECHEKDRDVLGCTKDLERHKQSVSYERCDVCGRKADKLIFCKNYITFKKGKFTDQTDQKEYQ